MNSEVMMCASSNRGIAWHNINWVGCNRQVKRLQARIVKATQDGDWGKVKSLQWLLTHSFSGQALAVKRVTENQGKKTAGVDGETWSTPDSKSQAVLSLKRRGYKPMPLRRVYIPKANGDKRPLGIPTMKDRTMQALHMLALSPVAETKADVNSYGFRPERATADAIAQCFNILSKRKSPQWILEGDIKGCFDNISHKWLIDNIPMDRSILHKWLTSGFIDQNQFFMTEAGTPQGGIISPVLANMTLDGLEGLLNKTFSPYGRVSNRNQVNFVRYADDFIITGSSKELLVDKVMPVVKEFLSLRGLVLSAEKTKVTHIEDGFDFLGQNVRKYGGKLLIKPSKKSTKALLDKVRGIVRSHKAITQYELIRLLNPIIKGWAEYHKHVVAKEIFTSMDYEIWNILWRWARRRHPNKNLTWLTKKYYNRVGNWERVFSVNIFDTESNTKTLLPLFRMSSVVIKRHRKIKGEANSYDPAWETYFEERLGFIFKDTLKGNRKLLTLWLSQNGICPICSEAITIQSRWHCHHIERKSQGGRDNNTNLVMLHPNCHRKVHSQGLKVVKPVFKKKT